MDKVKHFGSQVQRLIQGESLTRTETHELFSEVLSNGQPDLHQGALLAALVSKGETAEEIAGAWQAIDELDTVHAAGLPAGALFENSGTGMDQLKTFNVSTASAIVAAACGVTMARHGARGISSPCGTVDMLEALGVDVDCPVSVVSESIRTVGIGLFNGMSAAVHPGALGRILSQIRFGSTLNIAASLANPARPTMGLRGVYRADMVPQAAVVMRQIGYQRGLVVHGTDRASGRGMDEISPCGETLACEFDEQGSRSLTLTAQDFGFAEIPFEEIAYSGDFQREVMRFQEVIGGRGPQGCRMFTAMNAGAILKVAGVTQTYREGAEMALGALDSAAAQQKLTQWIQAQRA